VGLDALFLLKKPFVAAATPNSGRARHSFMRRLGDFCKKIVGFLIYL
jgi:hypothetical protein